jgi:hypothetical protein
MHNSEFTIHDGEWEMGNCEWGNHNEEWRLMEGMKIVGKK